MHARLLQDRAADSAGPSSLALVPARLLTRHNDSIYSVPNHGFGTPDQGTLGSR